MADKNIIKKLTEAIESTYAEDSDINFIDVSNLPLRDKVIEVLELLIEVLFPGYTGLRTITSSNIGFVIGDILCEVKTTLAEQVKRALCHQCKIKNCSDCDCPMLAEEATLHLLKQIPRIRQQLKTDIQAAFDSDPAAKSFVEIVLSYPGLAAIATHRIAHELYLKKIPLIPRIMSENAHQKTGIDIHPGAELGEYFFIDHGTGIVIGETAVIGKNVKIYQGVTLGALAPTQAESFRGKKRHPTIEDDVTIYAEATILGDVTIGKGTVIGGNVWIKESVPEGVSVILPTPELIYKERRVRKKTK